MTVPHEDIVGVVLAGGQARRMGERDKCLLEIDGRSLLARAIERLEPQVCTLVINANGDESRFSSFGQPVVKDTIEGFVGPLAGVLAGMRWARRNVPTARFIVTIAADTPFFPLDLTNRLRETSGEQSCLALANSKGRVQPVFGLWPLSLADHLEGALNSGMRRVQDWAGQHEMVEVPFEVFEREGQEIDPFFNVNHPQDLAIAELLARKIF